MIQREHSGERQLERQRERETERDRDREERERMREKETERQREKETERQREESESKRERERKKERKRETYGMRSSGVSLPKMAPVEARTVASTSVCQYKQKENPLRCLLFLASFST